MFDHITTDFDLTIVRSASDDRQIIIVGRQTASDRAVCGCTAAVRVHPCSRSNASCDFAHVGVKPLATLCTVDDDGRDDNHGDDVQSAVSNHIYRT